jgi:predicted AlkP superfamily pyrophosphatase or phosphodiesterase
MLEYSWYRNSSTTHEGDDEVTDVAIEHITRDKPDFAFVYLGTVDTAGHYYGWMSEGYLRQAERDDRNLARLLAALPDSAHVLVHADHGGHDRSHGENIDEDMTIPWMLLGPRIRPGYEIQRPVSLLDSAPTLARLLEIPVHRDWEGHCVEEALL